MQVNEENWDLILIRYDSGIIIINEKPFKLVFIFRPKESLVL